MKVQHDIKLDFDDVLLAPHRTYTASRKNVKLDRTFQFYHANKSWSGIPIMAANMDTTGTLAMSKALSPHRMITCLHKYYDPNTILQLEYCPFSTYTWYTLGIKDIDFDRLCNTVEQTNIVPNICIDVANGYTENFVKFCAKVRQKFSHRCIIMAGNVCTPEMVQELILHGGVDIVKIGIGPGSACTTRLKTGVGYPQLSAIIECAHAAHGLKSDEKRMGLICADGGCRTAGDVCKALAANADFVMLGGMLAGTEECEGEWEEGALVNWHEDKPPEITDKTVKKYLKFYGMSSKIAQDKHGEGLNDYRSSEGRSIKVPYKGPAKYVIQDILGGVRSCCAYIGATSIKDMSKCAEFIRVNRTHFDRSL
tara:strand:+ start:1423 stop:2523 length:1101 start_codon:yes stop_codon:yes gene_type:complete